MSVDELVKLLGAVTKLIGAVAWPALAAYVLIRFAPSLKIFIETIGEFSFKGAGFEASAKRRQAEAAAALAAATAARPESGVASKNAALQARDAADFVTEVVTPRVLRRAERSRILWVDDRPENNVYERQSLEALGANVSLARSTDEALELIKSQRFDAVISDMERPSDARAGYTLLDTLRKVGDQTPYIIYSGSSAPKHKEEAREHGALGATSRPSELFECVLSALRGAL